VDVVWWLPLVSMLAGCQVVFPLATADAPPVDTPPMEPDEDRDGHLDSEDNCPGISNDIQVDSDGDLIGDACDPSPQDDRDQLQLQAHFVSDFSGLSPSGTSFQLVDGSLETLGDIAFVDAALTAVLADSARTGLTVELGFTVEDLGEPLNDNRLILRFSSDTGVLDCTLREDDPTSSTSLAVLTTPSSGGEVDLLPSARVLVGTPQRIVLGAHENDGVDCSFDGATAHADGDVQGNVTLSIIVRKMRVRIDYVMAYDTTRP